METTTVNGYLFYRQIYVNYCVRNSSWCGQPILYTMLSIKLVIPIFDNFYIPYFILLYCLKLPLLCFKSKYPHFIVQLQKLCLRPHSGKMVLWLITVNVSILQNYFKLYPHLCSSSTKSPIFLMKVGLLTRINESH